MLAHNLIDLNVADSTMMALFHAWGSYLINPDESNSAVLSWRTVYLPCGQWCSRLVFRCLLCWILTRLTVSWL